MARMVTDEDHAIVAARHDAAYWASRLFIDRADPDNQPTPFEIEARLLARQTYREIAHRLGTDEDIVEAYERIFFNVLEPTDPARAKIECPGYITHQAIGPRLQHNLSDRHYDVLWKLFGYVGGSHVLDAMIGHAVNPVRPGGASGVGGFLREMTLGAMKAKAMSIAHTFRDNGFGAIEILNTFVKLVELERDGGATKTSEMLSNVDALCNFIPFAVGAKSANKFEGREHLISFAPGLREFDEAGIELTGRELLAIGSGHNVDAISLEYPALAAPPIHVPQEH